MNGWQYGELLLWSWEYKKCIQVEVRTFSIEFQSIISTHEKKIISDLLETNTLWNRHIICFVHLHVCSIPQGTQRFLKIDVCRANCSNHSCLRVSTCFEKTKIDYHDFYIFLKGTKQMSSGLHVKDTFSLLEVAGTQGTHT